jgi:hypothetical protein
MHEEAKKIFYGFVDNFYGFLDNFLQLFCFAFYAVQNSDFPFSGVFVKVSPTALLLSKNTLYV